MPIHPSCSDSGTVDNAKLLSQYSVTISPKLDNITGKVNRTIGFIKQQ